MSKQNRSYTNEFKREAIALAMDSKTIVSAARSLGIPEGTLHAWVLKAKSSGAQTITANDGTISQVNVGKVMDENKLLKKRLSRLEQEKEILKKAAQYFAAELR